MKSYRSRLEVVRDVLQASTHPTLKTHIQYCSNLSTTMRNRYLTLLLAHGLIEKASTRYLITSKGLQFLETFEKLSALFGAQELKVLA